MGNDTWTLLTPLFFFFPFNGNKKCESPHMCQNSFDLDLELRVDTYRQWRRTTASGGGGWWAIVGGGGSLATAVVFCPKYLTLAKGIKKFQS